MPLADLQRVDPAGRVDCDSLIRIPENRSVGDLDTPFLQSGNLFLKGPEAERVAFTILLLFSHSLSSLGNPDKGLISDISLKLRSSNVNLVQEANGLTSIFRLELRVT